MMKTNDILLGIKFIGKCYLLLSVLVLVSCSKKGKHSGNDVEEMPAISFYYLPENPQESLFSNYGNRALAHSTDFPEYDYTPVLSQLTDRTVVFRWPMLDGTMSTGTLSSMVYRLNAEGKWTFLTMYGGDSYSSIEPYTGWQVGGFDPDSEVTLRVVYNTAPVAPKLHTSNYSSKIVRFRTLPYPPVATIKVGNNYSAQAGTNRTISVTASTYYDGAINGKIYADSACTELVGEITNKVPLEVELPDEPGEYRFYATMTGETGVTSPCSTSYASYTLLDCPEDYVVVQGAPSLDTPPFCLMRTEARQGANDVAVPGFSEYPWEATPQEAKDACRRVGPNCDIMTNLEWMAVATQLENNNANWSNSFKSRDNYLNNGHVKNDLGVLNISDPNDEYDQLSTSEFRYRRTFKLSQGTLWDFGGNLAEWADNAEVGGEIFQPITNTCPYGPGELLDFEFSCPELDQRYYMPLNPLKRPFNAPSDSYIHSNFYMGRIWGTPDNYRGGSTEFAAARGGQAGDLENSGIYSLFLFYKMTDTAGFRCACHLSE